MINIVVEAFEEFRQAHAVRLVMQTLARNVADACRLYWNDCMRETARRERHGR